MSGGGGSTGERPADGAEQLKSRSGPDFLGLSRCAACYNQKANSMPRRADDASSSSAEDSGPEVDYESEAESSFSSSSSSSSGPEAERRSPAAGEAAEPESGAEDGDGQEEKNGTRKKIRRAPLVKSFSLPASLTPHLTSLLPRPQSVVSTLHLQVLPEKHNDDTYFTIRQKTEGSYGGGGGQENADYLPLPQPFQWQQMGSPWQQRPQPTLQQHQYQQQQQQQMSYQHKQQQPPRPFPPLSAQGQGLPPPPHTLPVLHPPVLHPPRWAPSAPQTHLHSLAAQPCWCCHRIHLPHSSWGRYSAGHLPR